MYVVQRVDAKKTRFGEADLQQLFQGIARVLVARGKKVVEFEAPAKLIHDQGELEAFVKAVIGPSGNLRAPSVRVGDMLLVGFNEKMWNAVF